MCSEIATDDSERTLQFFSVLPIALVPETAEPLRGVGLRNDGAGTHDFPTFVPGVASSTDLIQAAMGRGQVLRLRQGALAASLTRAIDASNILKFSQKLGNMFYERGTLSQLLREGGAEEPYHRCGTRLLFDKWGMRCDP